MTDTKATTRFVAGEWAVLRNDSGGRLLQVHTVLPDGDVTEVNDILSQQKYATPWRSRQIIKVASKDDAVAMVAAFELANDILGEGKRALKREFDRRVSEIIDKYSDCGDRE